jgi:hypothetical protein
MRTDTKENFRDEVAVLIEKTQFLREHAPNKPALIGEFGLATPKWGQSDYMKKDENLTHFHTSLWASAFAGGSGTAMFWWWDQLDRQNAYHHYRPLAEFLKGISFVGLEPIRASLSGDDIRVLGYQGKDRAYLWLWSNEATWWNMVVDNRRAKAVKPTVELSGLASGRYAVKWWDTAKGGVVSEAVVTLSQGPLSLSPPPFTRDIACKIER